jgi:8-amino-3,8-dideoxy-alpha-D-manno-octulosonate transaminase
MASIPGISFREIPDKAGDSATFLSFFLPSEDKARKAVAELAKAGVDGCFYWYGNNWHYLKQWGHLHRMNGAAKMPVELMAVPPDFSRIQLPKSDRIMGKTISMQIKLSWTEDMMEKRIEKINQVLKG